MKKNRKRGKGRKIFLFIGGIVLVIIIFFGYLVVSDLHQEDILKQEVINVSHKDLFKDDYRIEVKTTGDYAYIEEAVKKFYKELSDNVKVIFENFDNDEFTTILAPATLEKERPNFENSYQLLHSTKKNTLEALDKIVLLCDEEHIKGLVDREKVDDYSYDLYLTLMATKNDLKEFSELKNDIENLSHDIEEFLNKVEEVLNLLKENNSSWSVDNNQIYFNSNELVSKYNQLYDELQSLSNTLSEDSNSLEGKTTNQEKKADQI